MVQIKIFDCDLTVGYSCGLKEAQNILTTKINKWATENKNKIEIVSIGSITFETYGNSSVYYLIPVAYRLIN